MLELQFIGNIGKDAELQQNEKGSYSRFNVAVNEGNETQWVQCSMSGREKLVPYLTKGTKVFIRGRLKLEKWIGRDNSTHADLKCYVERIELMGGGQPQAQAQTSPNVPFQNQQLAQQSNNNNELWGGSPF